MANDPRPGDGPKKPAFNRYILGGCVSLLAIASVAALTRSSSHNDAAAPRSAVAVVPGATSTTQATAQEAATDDASASETADALANSDVRVVDGKLMRNGVQWTPFGVQLIGMVQSQATQDYFFNHRNDNADTQKKYEQTYKYFPPAYQKFGLDEFNAIKNWHANTIRVQVSKDAIDPGTASEPNSEYDPNYIAKLVQGVKDARSIGLNVIVSIQWERQIHEGLEGGLPGDRVIRDWQKLAPLLKVNGKSDNGILFEILNEPSLKPSADNAWAQWKTAMDAVVNAIRNTGSTNVVVADGLNFALTLHGLTPLNDKNVVYAVHAYFLQGTANQNAWQSAFGDAAQSVPVINGEWTTLTDGDYDPNTGYLCNQDTPQTALNLLNYQRDRHIGLVAVTYDTDKHWGGIVQDLNGKPTTFYNTDCQNALGRFGPGSIVKYWYTNFKLPDSPYVQLQ